MASLCGANCEECAFKAQCRGCVETCGSPFGGKCVAAEYIKKEGREKYAEFKKELLSEINALLTANGIPQAGALYELTGSYVDLAYPLPSGETVRFLDEKNIYLGAQIEAPGSEACYGVVADGSFILICSYHDNGADPTLLLFKKR